MQLGFNTLTPQLTATAYQVLVSGLAPPATPYWYGGVSTVWSDASLAPTSNWRSNGTGATDTNQVPGPNSNVHFSGLNGSAGVTTTLGADTSINSLNIDSAPPAQPSPAPTP